MSRQTVVAGIAAVALTGGAFTALPAFAGSPTVPASVTADANATDADQTGRDRQSMKHRGKHQGKKFLDELVADGTISQDQADAIKDQLPKRGQGKPSKENRVKPEDRLATLVENGTISQDQADAIIAKAKEHRAERGHKHEGHGKDRAQMKADLAAALNVTVADLETGRKAGKSLAEVAEANGMTKDQAVAAIAALFTTKAEEKGRDLTADQATKMAEHMVDRTPGDRAGKLKRPGMGR